MSTLFKEAGPKNTFYVAPMRSQLTTERRRMDWRSRFRRFATACIVETDIDTMAVIIMSFEVALIVALSIFPNKIILLPPPLWDGVWPRPPALAWVTAIFSGMLWHGLGWVSENCKARRNGTIASCILLCVICGDLFPRGPGLAVAVFILNLWQIILAGRLWVECSESKAKSKKGR